MRKILIASVAALSLASAGVATAAGHHQHRARGASKTSTTKASSHAETDGMPKMPGMRKGQSLSDASGVGASDDCAKQWKAQGDKTGSRKEFMATCKMN